MIIVVAGSFAETSAFARQNNLRNVSHVTNRDKIRGLRPTVVHLLPGYRTRRDIHAINAELANVRRQRPTPEFIDWDKVEGVFVRRGDDVESETIYDAPPVNPRKSEIALEKPAEQVIEDVQASWLAALTPDRLDTLEALAADVDQTDDTDDFFAMMDSANG